MDTTIATSVTELLRSLPDSGPQRDLMLLRAVDLYAASEATAALRSAAGRAHAELGAPPDARDPADASSRELVARLLLAASALWRGDGEGHHVDVDIERIEQLVAAISSPGFPALLKTWTTELRRIAAERPSTGACTVATTMHLWLWTASHVQHSLDGSRRLVAVAELADLFCWLIASRSQILELTTASGSAADDLPLGFRTDLCHVQAARCAGAVASRCAELVFGYRRHLMWDAEGCAACFQADDLDALEGLFPGFASSARGVAEVIEADGSHPIKAGPCARFDGVERFNRIRTRLDGCLTGARLTKDRAAEALSHIGAPTVGAR